ncbi:hypothetical protein [Nocardia wallacei]|uniref:hypothetical protein n=1 Tax=Nocardia wallacei TaxID=480035 RepID=UPI0024586D03|nr:hypothetical protein [Nocardia wallacei]
MDHVYNRRESIRALDYTGAATTRTGRSDDRDSAGFPDDARTSRNHAGEGLEDGYNVPGIVLCALGIVAMALALTAAGYGFAGWAVVAGVVAAVCAITGVTWLLLEHRRVKAKEGLALSDQQGH